MKRLLSCLVMTSILSIALLSCMGNKKETTAKDSQKENPAASNQHEDTYQPGQDWELAWSDEFKAGTIDANNWNSR